MYFNGGIHTYAARCCAGKNASCVFTSGAQRARARARVCVCVCERPTARDLLPGTEVSSMKPVTPPTNMLVLSSTVNI